MNYENENSVQTHKYKTKNLENKSSFCMSPTTVFIFATGFGS